MSTYTITVDLETNKVVKHTIDGSQEHSLDTPEAFNLISDLWLRCGWDNKHVYSFTWMGRPIIQLPEDMLRIQEVIYQIKPDVLIETGVAHGGSLIFYASLFKAMGHGRVIGIDVEIRPHNRKAIENHELFDFITLIEDSSTSPEVIDQVSKLLRPSDKVMVMLDSNHTKEHVSKELALYSPFVSMGSYIIAADGIMEKMTGAPRAKPDWTWNNPKTAAIEFANNRDDFILQPPKFAFNECNNIDPVTYWPSAWLYKVK